MQTKEEQILFEAIEAYKKGDGEKATFIYEETKKYAYSIIYQQVSRFKNQGVLAGDANAFAEDVMQELYLNLFTNIQKFKNENEKSIYKWISVVSYRMILDCVDKNKMEVLQFAKDEDFREESDIWDSSEMNDGDLEGNHEMLPEEALEDKEFGQLILDFINELPEAQAQTILLHFQGGMKYQEIADEMGVSLITVKTRMKKAKDSLEEIITKYEKKTGTKLHSVSILPILWLLYRKAAEDTVVPVAVDVAVAGSIASTSGAIVSGVGGVVATGVTKAISTKVLVAIVSTVVAAGGAIAGSQLIDKKQETAVEQSDSKDEEPADSSDNKTEEDTPSDDNKNDSGTEENEGSNSETNNQTQGEESENEESENEEPENQGNNNPPTNNNGNGNENNSGETEDNTNNSGSENTGNESTAAKGTKDNPYRIGEKIVITDGIIYNPSYYDSQEVYQFEITVTDYFTLEEALAKKGVEFSSGIVLPTVEATVKFTGGTMAGLPYEHTPISLKLLKENGYSYSWGGFMYSYNGPLYSIQNNVKYDILLDPSFRAEDEVWPYLGIDYYTADGKFHRIYVKLE